MKKLLFLPLIAALASVSISLWPEPTSEIVESEDESAPPQVQPKPTPKENSAGSVKLPPGLLAHRAKMRQDSGLPSRDEMLKVYHDSGIEAAWAAIEKVEEELTRGMLRKSVMSEMAKNGLAEEALEFVKEKLGLGRDRQRLVQEIISRSDLSPSATLNLYNTSDNDIDREGIGKGLSFLIMRHGVKNSEINLTTVPEKLRIEFAKGLGTYAIQRGSIPEVIESIRVLNGENSPHSEIVREFTTRLTGSTAKLKDFIKQDHSNKSSDDLFESIRSIARLKLAMSSPEWLINQASSNVNDGLLDSVPLATMMLVRNDPNEASRVLDSIPTNQSQLRSAMMSGLSGSAVRKNEYDTAWEWHDQIEAPETKEKVGDGIRSAEKQFIEKAAQTDPEGTIISILSKDSIHKEYLLKEAFQQWVTMDPFRANSWHEENQATLTEEQNQHIARSYAEQAIQNGEFEEARSWLKKVGDEEYRAPLQKEIEQATAEKQ